MVNSTNYLSAGNITPKGVLIHSTGANNSYIRRYVQPLTTDEFYNELIKKLGKNYYGNDWNHTTQQKGVNAFVGKLDDGTVASVQTLPWDKRPWGCGTGSKGSCNDGWIQFEICEDNLKNKDYFDKAYNEAVELAAYLCKLYKLNPKGTVSFKGVNVPVILCHQDSARLGLGSDHSDVYHWFDKYNKTMDDFRNDVNKLVNPPKPKEETPITVPFKVGDIVKVAENATWSSGKTIPKWVFTSTLYVRKIKNDDVTISIYKTGDVTGTIKAKFLSLGDAGKKDTSYKVKVTASALNVRKGPGFNNGVVTVVHKNDVYTIVDEQDGWGKLKSGAGWIKLEFTTKI